MSNWNMGSAGGEVTIAFNNDDSNGQVAGSLTFKGETYYVAGNWAAAGSVPGRNYSAFALWGSDQQGATQYVAMTGTLKGDGQAPMSMQVNLLQVSTGDDDQYGWDGVLTPL